MNALLNEALRTKVIDNAVYVDMDQLVQLIFDIANESALAASRLNDPGLGVMTLGVSHLGKALDAVLELQKEALAKKGQLAPDSGSQSDSGGVADQA